jgi:hypothetical protein
MLGVPSWVYYTSRQVDGFILVERALFQSHCNLYQFLLNEYNSQAVGHRIFVGIPIDYIQTQLEVLSWRFGLWRI